MRKEHKQNQLICDIKDILLDVVPNVTLNENTLFLEQLVKIVEKLNEPKVDTQAKLMERP